MLYPYPYPAHLISFRKLEILYIFITRWHDDAKMLHQVVDVSDQYCQPVFTSFDFN